MTCAVQGAADAAESDDKLPAIDIVYSWIEDIGKIFAVSDKAAALVANMKAGIAATQEKIKGRPAPHVFSGDDYNGTNTPIALRAGTLGVAGSAVYAWCSSLRVLTDTDVQRLVDAADQPETRTRRSKQPRRAHNSTYTRLIAASPNEMGAIR